jgi:hypothetical protein
MTEIEYWRKNQKSEQGIFIEQRATVTVCSFGMQLVYSRGVTCVILRLEGDLEHELERL